MATLHYAPKTFLRGTSNKLLQAKFQQLEVLTDIPWENLGTNKADVVYEGWQNLPDSKRVEIERTFEEADALACDNGIKILIEEGSFHKIDLKSELAPLSSYRDKALYVSIVYPHIFQVAGTIHHAHTLSMRYWRRRGDLPSEEPNTDSAAITEFQDAISAYFRQNEGRGHRCTVDNYLYSNRYHYFFAYPDNYPNIYLGHNEQGKFVRKPQRPTFEIVFVFDPHEGTLDVHAQGGKEVQESLQTIFCRTLLGRELPPESQKKSPYELNGLKSRDFLNLSFATDPADGIEEIQIRKLRLAVLGGKNQRITLEADSDGGPEAIYDMLEKCINRENIPNALFNITLAQFHFRFVHTGQGRQRTLTFEVSHPNSSNLKSCRHEDLRIIGEKYLRQWGVDRS